MKCFYCQEVKPNSCFDPDKDICRSCNLSESIYLKRLTSYLINDRKGRRKTWSGDKVGYKNLPKKPHNK